MNWLDRLRGRKEFGYEEAVILDEKNIALAQAMEERIKENGGEIHIVDVIIEASTQATLNAIEVMGVPNVVLPQIVQIETSLTEEITEAVQENTDIVRSEKDAEQALLDAIERLKLARIQTKAQSEERISENTLTINDRTHKKEIVSSRRKYAGVT